MWSRMARIRCENAFGSSGKDVYGRSGRKTHEHTGLAGCTQIRAAAAEGRCRAPTDLAAAQSVVEGDPKELLAQLSGHSASDPQAQDLAVVEEVDAVPLEDLRGQALGQRQHRRPILPGQARLYTRSTNRFGPRGQQTDEPARSARPPRLPEPVCVALQHTAASRRCSA